MKIETDSKQQQYIVVMSFISFSSISAHISLMCEDHMKNDEDKWSKGKKSHSGWNNSGPHTQKRARVWKSSIYLGSEIFHPKKVKFGDPAFEKSK